MKTSTIFYALATAAAVAAEGYEPEEQYDSTSTTYITSTSTITVTSYRTSTSVDYVTSTGEPDAYSSPPEPYTTLVSTLPITESTISYAPPSTPTYEAPKYTPEYTPASPTSTSTGESSTTSSTSSSEKPPKTEIPVYEPTTVDYETVSTTSSLESTSTTVITTEVTYTPTQYTTSTQAWTTSTVSNNSTTTTLPTPSPLPGAASSISTSWILASVAGVVAAAAALL